MKVLHVSGTHTHPNNKGNAQGIHRLSLQMKKQGWDVDFLYYGNRVDADIEGMRTFFGEDHFFLSHALGTPLKYRLKGRLRHELDRLKITKYIAMPYECDEIFVKDLADEVMLMHDKNRYDIIWIEYYYQSRLFTMLDEKTVKVIHTHDRFSDRQKIFQKEGKVPEWFYLTQNGEREALSRADVVASVQEEESVFFRDLLKGKNTKVITLGHFIGDHESAFIYNDQYGFIGGNNRANILAVQHYIKDILPKVRKLRPDLQFVIAGAVCNFVPDSDSYVKLGIIHDICEFYNRISFVVSPLTIGTGINIKNIEALAYGKPVITTSVGQNGLPDSREIVSVCDDDDKFAETVAALASDEELCRKMSMASKMYVDSYNNKNREKLKEIEDIVHYNFPKSSDYIKPL